MSLADRITDILTPHMGGHTADSVARHLCAKHGVGEGPVPAEKLAVIHDTLRRGLVAFVGTEKADVLARECMQAAKTGEA